MKAQGSWQVALPGAAAAVPEARHAVTEQLVAWHCEPLRDATALVVSELVTNAVLHARTPLEVSLLREPDGVRVSVTDGGEGLPQTHPTLGLGTTGRGLLLLEALALSWGVEPLPEGGKTVWAVLTEESVAR